jgi:hypothetical protein
MKNTIYSLIIALSAPLALMQAAHAGPVDQAEGRGILVHFGFPSSSIDSLYLDGGVAEAMYQQMSGIAVVPYANTCEGTEVQVGRRQGSAFTCEEWPASCWGKLHYKCEATLDVANGAIRAK